MSDCGVGEAIAEVDPERGQRRAPVVGVAPLALRAGDREVEQLAGGVLSGEAAAGLDDLADLAVERLDRVGRVDRSADVGREGQERDDPLPMLKPALRD